MKNSFNIITIIVLLDDNCNLSCKYCYFGDEQRTTTTTIRNKQYRNIMNNHIEKIKSYIGRKDVINVEFSGFFPKHINFLQESLAIINNSNSGHSKINFYVQLNGLDTNYELIKLIKNFDISVGISLDGPGLLNDKVRITKNGKGTSKQIEKSIRLIRNNDIKYFLRCTITKYNYEYPEILFNYFNSLKPDGIFINKLIMKGNAIKNTDVLICYDDFINFYSRYHSLVFHSNSGNLLDNNLKKWFYRFNNQKIGWSHFCSTGLCNSNGNDLLVLSPTKTAKCPKYLISCIIPFSNIEHYRLTFCSKCPVFKFSQGGCPLGNNYSESGLSDECKHTRYLYNEFINRKGLYYRIIKDLN